VKDSVVSKVVKEFQDRSDLGIKKYGTTLDKNELPLRDWLVHAKEEMMDQLLYIQRAIDEIDLP
jgi:hypothetical protein